MAGEPTARDDHGPGRRVQDHLANERTFLAWVRTALGTLGVGFVMARMGIFLRRLALSGVTAPEKVFWGGHGIIVTGVAFLALGALLFGWAGHLYHRTRAAIETGDYAPAGRTVTVLVAVMLLGSLLLIGFVLWSALAADG